MTIRKQMDDLDKEHIDENDTYAQTCLPRNDLIADLPTFAVLLL